MNSYVEDRIVPHLDGTYKIQTRLIDDDEPDAWHTLDSFLTRAWAEQIIASRAAIRARIGEVS